MDEGVPVPRLTRPILAGHRRSTLRKTSSRAGTLGSPAGAAIRPCSENDGFGMDACTRPVSQLVATAAAAPGQAEPLPAHHVNGCQQIGRHKEHLQSRNLRRPAGIPSTSAHASRLNIATETAPTQHQRSRLYQSVSLLEVSALRLISINGPKERFTASSTKPASPRPLVRVYPAAPRPPAAARSGGRWTAPSASRRPPPGPAWTASRRDRQRR